MPIWAMLLQGSLYVLAPVFAWYYIRFLLVLRKFNRTYSLTENANSFGRVDELRSINLELALVGKRFIYVLLTLAAALGGFTYLWAIPHSQGLL